jgi:hypothetical protein
LCRMCDIAICNRAVTRGQQQRGRYRKNGNDTRITQRHDCCATGHSSFRHWLRAERQRGFDEVTLSEKPGSGRRSDRLPMYPRTEDDREKRNRRRKNYRTHDAVGHVKIDKTQFDTNRPNPIRLRWLHMDAVAFSGWGIAGGGIHRDRNSKCLNGITIRRPRPRPVHFPAQHAASRSHFRGELCERHSAARTVHHARQSQLFVGVPVAEG